MRQSSPRRAPLERLPLTRSCSSSSRHWLVTFSVSSGLSPASPRTANATAASPPPSRPEPPDSSARHDPDAGVQGRSDRCHQAHRHLSQGSHQHLRDARGTASIFVNDDGMQLISEEDAQARRDFYDEHNIGWVARPGHRPKPNLEAGERLFLRRAQVQESQQHELRPAR